MIGVFYVVEEGCVKKGCERGGGLAREERPQQFQGALGGSPKPLGELLSALTHRLGIGWVGDELLEQSRQLFSIRHLPRRMMSEQLMGDRFEVMHVRAKHHRLPRAGRLKRILSSMRDEAAADKDGGGERVVTRELAECVHKANLPPLAASEMREPRGCKGGLMNEPLHFREAL